MAHRFYHNKLSCILIGKEINEVGIPWDIWKIRQKILLIGRKKGKYGYQQKLSKKPRSG